MEPEVEFEALKVTAAEYDLVVIGSGSAGQKGAIAAAKARKRVAVIDRTVMMGGVSVHTGTIPSKTLRVAIFQLTGLTVKALIVILGRVSAKERYPPCCCGACLWKCEKFEFAD